MQTTPTLTVLATAFVLATAAFSVSLPGAEAHECSSADPAYNCGACSDGTTNGTSYHHHTYANGTTYCESRACTQGSPCDWDLLLSCALVQASREHRSAQNVHDLALDVAHSGVC